MNYLAHGYRFVDRPYFVAGTALPDWLRVCGRRIRPSRRETLVDAAGRGGAAGEMAAGLLRHWLDDATFHGHAPFLTVSRRITACIRRRFPGNRSLRAHFLGHILTEMLLDASLERRRPGILDAYYASLDHVDSRWIEQVAGSWLRRPAERLAEFVEIFRSQRFIADYLSDRRLFFRLEQVAARVRLPELPEELESCLPEARELVETSAFDLLDFEGRGGVEPDRRGIRALPSPRCSG